MLLIFQKEFVQGLRGFSAVCGYRGVVVSACARSGCHNAKASSSLKSFQGVRGLIKGFESQAGRLADISIR